MAATGKITSRYEQVRDIRRNANDNENALGAVHLWEFLPDRFLAAAPRPSRITDVNPDTSGIADLANPCRISLMSTGGEHGY
jgi:hypothetical protein